MPRSKRVLLVLPVVASNWPAARAGTTAVGVSVAASSGAMRDILRRCMTTGFLWAAQAPGDRGEARSQAACVASRPGDAALKAHRIIPWMSPQSLFVSGRFAQLGRNAGALWHVGTD